MSESKQAAGNVQQLPSKAQFRALRDCKTLQEAFESRELRDRIAAAAPRHLDADTLLRTFIQACSKTPLIYKCDLRQALGAFMSLSFLGLPPGTVLGLSHLIPFARTKWNPSTRKREPNGYDLQVIIGYQGYVELAFRSGFIRDLASGIVYPGDHFDFERGSKRFLTHKQSLDTDPDKMTPRAAYAIAKFTNDGEEFEVMSWSEIERIRNRSQAYRTALAAKDRAETDGKRAPLTWSEAPWVRDPGEMGRKTAIRRLAKLLPKSPELMAGIGIEDASDAGRRLDFGPVIDGTATPMDGLPEQHDGEDPGPPDPGAAHTDRRTDDAPENVPPPNKIRPTRTRASTGERQQSSSKARPAPTPAAESPPAFEAVMISAWGEIGGEFTDPVEFARALVDEYRRVGGIALDAANLIEHNGEAIDQARASPEAAELLRVLDEPPPAANDQGEDAGEDADDPGFDPEADNSDPDENAEQNASESGTDDSPPPPPFFAAIEPPMSNGKPSWSGWLALLRDELATIDMVDLLGWTETQRGKLAECPMAQRALAVQSITQRFAKLGRTPPGYLADLITTQTQRQKDEKWLADRRADLAAIEDTIEGRHHFQALVQSTMTRTVMARLRADDPEMFDRADAAFNDKHKTLPGGKPPAGDGGR